MTARTALFTRGSRWLATLAAGSLVISAGCGTRREVTQTLLCRIDAGRLIAGSLTVSADRRHVMYAEGDSTRQRVVADGRAGPWYDGILARTLALSLDGKRHAYGAGKGKLRFVVSDGVPQAPGDGVREGTPVYSPDGQRLAWGRLKDGFWSMVVDGREGWKFDELWPPVFSPDGRHVAYEVRTGPRKAVVLDSVLQSSHDDIADRSLAFSPDGAHLLYTAVDKGVPVPIYDGQPAPAGGVKQRGRDRIAVRRVGSVVVGLSVVHDTVTGPVYDHVAGLAYSADSGRFGYVARQGGEWFTVAHGKRGKSHPFIFDNSLAFTPDTRHVLFATQAGKQQYIVIDDQPGRGFDLILDAAERPVVFDSDGSYHYLALSGDSVFVVDEWIR